MIANDNTEKPKALVFSSSLPSDMEKFEDLVAKKPDNVIYYLYNANVFDIHIVTLEKMCEEMVNKLGFTLLEVIRDPRVPNLTVQ